MKATKIFLFKICLITLCFLVETLVFPGDFGPKVVNNKTPKENKPLDSRLIITPTLKQLCLSALPQKDYSSERLPQEVKQAASAFNNIHHENFPLEEDLHIAFNFCAPKGLQEKVYTINERNSQRRSELHLFDIQIDNNVLLDYEDLFADLDFILANYCDMNINKGLITLGRRNPYKKRKVLYSILLSLGANINYYGSVDTRIRFTTPLITATIYKRTSCVELLLKNKARVDEKTSDGYNAYTLAKKWPDQTIANLLREHGAIYIPVKQDLDDFDLDHESGQMRYHIAAACTLQ